MADSHAEAHAKFMGEDGAGDPSPDAREAAILGATAPPADPPAEPEGQPSAEPEAGTNGTPPAGESQSLVPDAKGESLSNLRKMAEQERQAREALESQVKSMEQEREQYEARLATYDYRQTREWQTKFVQPVQENVSTIQTLWKTYTGEELDSENAATILHADYQSVKTALSKAKIDRADKFLEVWESNKIIEENAKKALSTAPQRLKEAKLVEAEEDQARQRIEAQRLHKEREDVKASLRSDVVGFIDLADNPEYNAKVAGRVAKYESAVDNLSSRDTLALIGKGVVYEELVAEILDLRNQLKSHASNKGEVEKASRFSSGGQRTRTKPEQAQESHRDAHKRFLGT